MSKNAKPENMNASKKTTKQRIQEREGEKKGSKSAMLCNDLSDAFLETYPVKTLEDGDLRIYDNGIYQTCKNKYTANNLMVEIAGDMGLILTPSQIKDALEMVKSKTPSEEITTPLNLIPVNNGVLNIDTMTLEDYSPEKVFLSKYPINYNPEAGKPIKFMRMLETTFKGSEEQIPIVQEMFGYCFLRSYYIEVVYFLIGSGGNGKTLLLNILSALLGGSEHCSYLSLKELAEPKNENMLYDLFGKSANVCGDTGKQKLKETDILKKATGNDYIRARRLYKESFNFKNYAKIILSFNRLPEVEDFSDGFKRRLCQIEFNNKFVDGAEGTNKNLEKEIIESGELEGVFLWALEGLKRLLKNSKLSNNKSASIKGLEYSRKSNPMHYFVRECIEEKPNNFVKKSELLEAYTKYANYNRMPQLTAQEFKKELIKECEDIDIYTKEKRNQSLESRPYGFVNIAIDKEALAEHTGDVFKPSLIEGKPGEQGHFRTISEGFDVAGTYIIKMEKEKT
ncbi:MAG: phage/plasmid primase, P4 family [Methanosarcina mazei]